MKSSWVYFRYAILDEYDDAIPARAHAGVLDEVKGLPAPYRNQDPSPEDINNYVMELRHEQIENERCSIFVVGHTIATRVERRYNKKKDQVELTNVSADDMRLTNVIMVPRLRMLAAKDGSGDRLSALSGVGRLRAVVEHNADYSFGFDRTSSHDDVLQAMKNLYLDEFTLRSGPSIRIRRIRASNCTSS